VTVANQVGHSIRPLLGHPYVRLVSGDGVFVTDDAGLTYLDAVAGVGVMTLGYGRDDLAAALVDQARRLPFAQSMRFENEPAERLATRLAAFAPPGLTWSFFCNGGSEALDSTVKLVRQYWLDRGQPGKWKVIGRRPGFHGNTLMALSVGYHAGRRARYQPYITELPHLRAPWIFRCERGDTPEGPFCDDCSGRALASLIDAEGPESVAAFVSEPIVGAAAPAITPPPGYYETIREICDRYDVLMVSDEVMTGIGRTGRNFGIEHWDAVPDVMLVAKGISGGYAPLAGVVAHERVMEVIRNGAGRYENTFTWGGNPMACAVGAATIEAVEREGVVAHVAELESEFFNLLDGLRRHPIVGDVRGKGLMAGIEFVQPGGTDPYPPDARVSARVDQAAREAGLLVYPCQGIVDGVVGDSILMLPPLVITRAEIGQLVDRLDAALETVSRAIAAEAA
jgi:adenosylmethionine-8-amino-7-oxononanoate aminotransferase